MADGDHRTPVDVIEIELTGDGPLAAATRLDDEAGPPPPNWRRLIAIGIVGGSLLGIAGGLVLRALETDRSTEPPPSTGPADELSSQITTPPTLVPLDTLPPADLGTGVDEGPQPTTSQDRALFDDVVRTPVYPQVDGVPLSDVFAYQIEPAVEALADDVARRSHTRVELGVGGYVLDVTIERDPVRDRYQVIFRQGDLTEVAIVDTATNSTYVNPGTENLRIVLNEDLLAGSTAADINEYFDRMLLGPVRPDTFSPAGTTGRSLFDLDDVGAARQFATQIDGELVPEWQIYLFSPVFEFRPDDRPADLDYLVYVDERGDLVQVDGVSRIGDVTQLVSHRIERLEDDARVELPEPIAPALTVPGTTASTEPPGSSPLTTPSTSPVPPTTAG